MPKTIELRQTSKIAVASDGKAILISNQMTFRIANGSKIHNACLFLFSFKARKANRRTIQGSKATKL